MEHFRATARPKNRFWVLRIAAIFLLAPAIRAQSYRVLHNFGAPQDGSIPSGIPLVDSKGQLAGNTYDGGTGGCSDYGCGLTYALIPQYGANWKEIPLHEFTGTSDGATPVGNLVLDNAGNLYGTENGGGGGEGSVFELSGKTLDWSLDPIYGPYFTPGLLLDQRGNLYGFFGQGNLGSGAIGELSAGVNGWTDKVLYSFCSPHGGCPDGEGPRAPLSWDAKGNLYGTTEYGGISNLPCPGSLGCGVAFQMTLDGDGTWSYHVMHRFATTQTDGQYPDGGLAVDAVGNAYGVAGEGGPYANGTIFRLTPANDGSWTQTVLYGFPNCANGCFPGGTMVFDKAGNLYGIADGGIPGQECGSYTCGVVFRLARQRNGGWKYSTVHRFTGADGAFPWGVVYDGKGHLFGTTQAGGTYNSGVVFEISQ